MLQLIGNRMRRGLSPVTLLIWIGIVLCISQSAMLSGLNLAFFTISKLELRIEVAKKNNHARRILALREDANFLLATILWGDLAVNVLLTMLSFYCGVKTSVLLLGPMFSEGFCGALSRVLQGAMGDGVCPVSRR